MPNLMHGSIVWARVPDENGVNHKERPAVIVTATDDIDVNDPLVAVAVTGTFSNPLRESQVALPFHPSGNTRTKLRRPTVAVCDWIVRIKKADILQVAGIVPPGPLTEIMEKVEALLDDL